MVDAFRYGLAGQTSATRRSIATAVTPIALLLVHVAFYGNAFLGVPLLVVVGTAGALFGASFGLVGRGDEGSSAKS